MSAIDGYESESDEVRALVEQQLDVEDLADPTLLYVRATKLHAMFTAAALECTRLRAEAAAQLSADGMSYAAIAAHLGGMTRGRAQQLVEQGRRSL